LVRRQWQLCRHAERRPESTYYLKKKLKNASVGRIVIERPAKNARFTIYSSRPGVVIGKKGEDIEVLKSA
jgi:small subunit ribosomal protein S3